MWAKGVSKIRSDKFKDPLKILRLLKKTYIGFPSHVIIFGFFSWKIPNASAQQHDMENGASIGEFQQLQLMEWDNFSLFSKAMSRCGLPIIENSELQS